MYLSISHSFLDRFAWNMDQIQAISHVHTAAWPNNRSQPVITGYWPVIENFQNWKNRTDNFQKRQKPDRWSGHKSVQFSPVSVFFPVLQLDFETLVGIDHNWFSSGFIQPWSIVLLSWCTITLWNAFIQPYMIALWSWKTIKVKSG